MFRKKIKVKKDSKDVNEIDEATRTREIEMKLEEIESSEDKKNTLEDKKNTLEDKKNTLEDKKNTLEDKKNTLKNKKNTLSKEKGSIKKSHEKRVSEKNEKNLSEMSVDRLIEEKFKIRQKLDNSKRGTKVEIPSIWDVIGIKETNAKEINEYDSIDRIRTNIIEQIKTAKMAIKNKSDYIEQSIVDQIGALLQQQQVQFDSEYGNSLSIYKETIDQGHALFKDYRPVVKEIFKDISVDDAIFSNKNFFLRMIKDITSQELIIEKAIDEQKNIFAKFQRLLPKIQKEIIDSLYKIDDNVNKKMKLNFSRNQRTINRLLLKQLNTETLVLLSKIANIKFDTTLSSGTITRPEMIEQMSHINPTHYPQLNEIIKLEEIKRELTTQIDINE